MQPGERTLHPNTLHPARLSCIVVVMAPTVYSDVLARNIRAARNRHRLGQATVVARMRALGYTSWHRPTIGNVERGERRVTAEEILGLAEALGTSVGALMAPVEDDKIVEFPSGAAVTVEHVRESVRGEERRGGPVGGRYARVPGAAVDGKAAGRRGAR